MSTEREIKLAVDDRAALDRVRAVAGGEARPPVQQFNRFFDSPSYALRRAGYGLRLRTESGPEGNRHLLAVKGPREAEHSEVLSRRREVELEVSEDDKRAILEGEADPIALLAARLDDDDRAFVESLRARLDGELAYIGAFENERVRVDTVMVVDGLGYELVLELDSTLFPGDVLEHEVELEIPEDLDGKAAVRALRSLLAIAGVAGRPARGKASRFFERLQKGDP